MATSRKKIHAAEPEGNFEQIKKEVITLLTGQQDYKEGEFDYVAMLKRVTVLLIATYGIVRLKPLRSLALSILGAMVTKWLSERAGESLVPAHAHA